MHVLTWFLVSLRGLAQLAFADRAWAGALVLTGIALISPWAAVGAVTGVLCGTLAGYALPTYTRADWRIGLSGFNSAIIGLVWGGFFANNEWKLAGLTLTLMLCVTLEWLLRKLLARWDLPMLSMPAMVALSLTLLAYLLADQPFWPPQPPLPFGSTGIVVAVLCVIAAMTSQSVIATLQAVVLSAATALLFSVILGVDGLALSGLWALVVAPASFGLHGVFFAGTLTGALAGLVAALIAILIWSLWTFSDLALSINPLVAPFIIGSWLALLLLRRFSNPILLQPEIWQAAACLAQARTEHRPIVAFSGAGLSDASITADYASGCWMNPELPPEYYDSAHFTTSRQCRLWFWDACERVQHQLHSANPSAKPSATQRNLAGLERQGWLDSCLTQNVDKLQREAGTKRLIPLLGSIDNVECISCNIRFDWPPGQIWNRFDLRCKHCQGLLRPAVHSLTEALPSQKQQEVDTTIKDTAVLLLIDAGEPPLPVQQLLDKLCLPGTQMIFIGSCAHPGSQHWCGINSSYQYLHLKGPAEQTLAALQFCLRCRHAARLLDNLNTFASGRDKTLSSTRHNDTWP
ncbi:MAG: urea transporter [Motiliproteus sp.]